MKVSIGNTNAIEGYRLPESDDPERIHYRPLDGERSTDFLFPETLSVSEALMVVVETLPRHMDIAVGAPEWIESDDPLLKKLLCQHYGVSDKKRKPVKWGDGSSTITEASEDN